MTEITEDTFIAVKCPDCGTALPVKYKHRNKAVCKSCFHMQSIIVNMRPVTKPHDHEDVSIPKEKHITWKEYRSQIGSA